MWGCTGPAPRCPRSKQPNLKLLALPSLPVRSREKHGTFFSEITVFSWTHYLYLLTEFLASGFRFWMWTDRRYKLWLKCHLSYVTSTRRFLRWCNYWENLENFWSASGLHSSWLYSLSYFKTVVSQIPFYTHLETVSHLDGPSELKWPTRHTALYGTTETVGALILTPWSRTHSGGSTTDSGSLSTRALSGSLLRLILLSSQQPCDMAVVYFKYSKTRWQTLICKVFQPEIGCEWKYIYFLSTKWNVTYTRSDN